MQNLSNKPALRIALAALIAIALSLVIAADHYHWFRANPADMHEPTLECPALEQGCSFNLDGKSIRVTSNAPLEAGKPFVLGVEGDISSARAVWRMLKMDMGPNNYTLVRTEGPRWTAPVTLPPCPHGGKSWQLHLEIDGKAANINTLIRDNRPADTHPMGKM